MNLNIPVTVASAAPAFHGEAAIVTSVGGPVTLTSKSTKSAGIELYRVDVGNADLSDQLAVHLGILDPGDMSGVLHKGWVQVGLYRPVASGGEYTISDPRDGSLQVSLVSGDQVQGRMQAANADLVLRPGLAGDSTLYVIASVVNHSGAIPPGQQNFDLRFFIDVRMR